MRKVTSSNTVLIFAVITTLLAACARKSGQSETLTAFANTHSKIVHGFYFYPSTVRMLGKIMGGESGTALEGIERGRLFAIWYDDEKKEPISLDEAKTDIEAEGFEMLISMKSKGVKVDAYQRDGEPPAFIIFVNDPDSPFVIELNGELSIDALRQIATMDFEKANDLLNIFPEPEVEKVDKTEQNPETTN